MLPRKDVRLLYNCTFYPQLEPVILHSKYLEVSSSGPSPCTLPEARQKLKYRSCCEISLIYKIRLSCALSPDICVCLFDAISNGNDWLFKDYFFVLAVVFAVLVGGLCTEKYKQLEMSGRMQHARDLENVDFIYGDAVQLKLNTVTCILFFGTWCRKSRKALQILSILHQTMLAKAIQFVALTQESREELAMYEIKGRTSSNFCELKEFPFTIGIETGLISKEYLVKCNLYKVPQLFIVGKNKDILWYGNPCDQIVEIQICAALEQVDVKNFLM
ncbi:Thioredoxin-like fold [Plasmopara halstedii]|uniref:Thioredoxin-like fold n=1 Tax=Plasmopara halstedii TaxID=4781 RepID=A0A0P1ANZ4_PLAHL|nr:Thioredoxin-like fold [Plasmopara halstedii]CEG43004.1 Thioredoxin-like fold [Plasmopara halstedii]|eukprot:XP_024579373.1 Thioredoxin-like fold [Plasmopara halstedii]